MSCFERLICKSCSWYDDINGCSSDSVVCDYCELSKLSNISIQTCHNIYNRNKLTLTGEKVKD